MRARSAARDLNRNFVVFDAGSRRFPAAPVHGDQGGPGADSPPRRGVIWHTQGSGKSILMVLLAKWLLEHDPQARC